MLELTIPETAADITPAWMSAALRSRYPLASISALRVRRLRKGAGFVGRVYRVFLTCDKPAESLPKSVIVKLAAEAESTRSTAADLAFYAREARFYRELSARVAVRAPECFHLALAADGQSFVLVLEDFSKADVGDAMRGLSVRQALAAVTAVAQLHAQWWNCDRNAEAVSWLPGWGDTALGEAVTGSFRRAWPRFRGDFSEHLGHELRKSGDLLMEVLPQLAQHLGKAPHTFTHGDFRAENLIFPIGTVRFSPIVIDWQIIAIGKGIFDVGYLLSQGMDSGLRHQFEWPLVQHYHEMLCRAGISDYPFDICLLDYRLAILYGLVYVVMAHSMAATEIEYRGAFISRLLERVGSAIADGGGAQQIFSKIA